LYASFQVLSSFPEDVRVFLKELQESLAVSSVNSAIFQVKSFIFHLLATNCPNPPNGRTWFWKSLVLPVSWRKSRTLVSRYARKDMKEWRVRVKIHLEKMIMT